jgi:hypothetical protein
MKQGIAPSRDQVRARLVTRTIVQPRQIIPVAQMPTWKPLEDRAWREVYAKIDTGKALK